MKITPLFGCLLAVTVLFSTGTVAQQSKLDLIPAGRKLTAQDLANIKPCGITFKLKAGMTSSEANDAIDAAFDRFVKCMKTNALKAKAPQRSD